MSAVLPFGVLLLVAVLLSERASRTILSAAVLFLVAGVVLGRAGVLATEPAEFGGWLEGVLALVLLTDGLHVDLGRLQRRWKGPFLALGLGLPVTMLLIGVAARLLTGMDWVRSLLLGAVLSPTDPLLSAAFISDERVPLRIRELLNTESGLNDGLALPLVVVLLDLARDTPAHGAVAWELGAGLVLGALVAAAAVGLERLSFLGAHESARGLLPVAVGIVVFGLCEAVDGNVFLGEFAAGAALARLHPEARDAFSGLGDVAVELAKLAVLLEFGALLSGVLTRVSVLDAVFAGVVLLAVRPIAVAPLAFGLDRRAFASVAWLGPRGIASVFYALLVLSALGRPAQPIYELALLVVSFSIVAHASTDVLLARWVSRSGLSAAASEAT